MENSLLLINGLVFINGELKSKHIICRDGKIENLLNEIDLNDFNDYKIIDCRNKIISPGFIDLHVHLRDPGFTYKEDINSGTSSAARGGFTTIMSMPNTNPVLDSVHKLKGFNEDVLKHGKINVIPYASVTKKEFGKELVDIKGLSLNGFKYFSDDGVGIKSSNIMYKAMKEICEVDGILAAHCEDIELRYNGSLHEGNKNKELGINGILSSCESVHIARDIMLALETNVRYHVCHISTKEGVHLVRLGKILGGKITAEVTPHHLVLCEEDILDGNSNFKMNPPLRSKFDREELINGILDGTIDCIATDHAPHSKEEKNKDIEKSPFGIVGFETAFKVLYTKLVKSGIITIENILSLLTENPASIFDIKNKGKIEIGYDCDLVVIDLTKESNIDSKKFLSKSENTPFEGMKVFSEIILTIKDGKIVYKENGNE